MAINKVEICGVDTGKLPRISYKKSTELLERIKSGDESARDEFIQANLRLVLSAANSRMICSRSAASG